MPHLFEVSTGRHKARLYAGSYHAAISRGLRMINDAYNQNPRKQKYLLVSARVVKLYADKREPINWED